MPAADLAIVGASIRTLDEVRGAAVVCDVGGTPTGERRKAPAMELVR
jgi:hypothetical protein